MIVVTQIQLTCYTTGLRGKEGGMIERKYELTARGKKGKNGDEVNVEEKKRYTKPIKGNKRNALKEKEDCERKVR